MSEQEFSDFEIDKNVKAVVKGVTAKFNFRVIATASLYLADPDVVFVATNEDHTFICGESMRQMPDVGATLRAIEASCGRQAFTVGKPQPYALNIILQDHFQANKDSWDDPSFRSKIVYIGDNMFTDVMFAKNAGIKACLVLSGMTKSTDPIPD